MMKSIVICGSMDKNGLLVGPMRNNKDISKNEWEFTLSTLILTAKHEAVNGIFEIGCSLNSSESYDYKTERYVTKNTTVSVKKIEILPGQSVTIDFPETISPYFRVENVKDRVEISIQHAGTGSTLPHSSVDFVCHIILRRIR